MPIPFLSLQDTHASLAERLHAAARRVIDSGSYINGSEVKDFAAALSATLGLGEVVPVSNGLDAIRLIIRGYIENGRLRPGDEVILPANTYIASLLPVTEFGLTPILVKPSPVTFGLDWEEAERQITTKTKAVMTVHLYGNPSWNFDIADRMRRRGILLIEDNAQAIGASIVDPRNGKHVYTGALGDAAAFSFYPTKNIGALGDAGAVATSDTSLAHTVRSLANYGTVERYHNDYTGYNCRMDELQAALLKEKLFTLPDVTSRRNASAKLYDRLIVNPIVKKPDFIPGTTQVWHQYVILTPNRDALRNHLADCGVATDIHYPLTLFDQKCYNNPEVALRKIADTYDVVKRLSDEILSLPIANVSSEDIKEISTLINSFS